MTKVSVNIRGVGEAVRKLRRAETAMSEAFYVGRFLMMTEVMRTLIMPRVPRQTGFLRSTAYITREGKLGFSAIYAARVHELASKGTFFVRAPLTENTALLGQLWAARTQEAFRQRQTLASVVPVYPLLGTLRHPPRLRHAAKTWSKNPAAGEAA